MFRALFTHHQEVKIVLHRIWYHHTGRPPNNRPVQGLLYLYAFGEEIVSISWKLIDQHRVRSSPSLVPILSRTNESYVFDIHFNITLLYLYLFIYCNWVFTLWQWLFYM